MWFFFIGFSVLSFRVEFFLKLLFVITSIIPGFFCVLLNINIVFDSYRNANSTSVLFPHSLNKAVCMLKLLVVAIVGDKSTDTDDDARWTLGRRAPWAQMGGWVGGIHTVSTGGGTTSKTRK